MKTRGKLISLFTLFILFFSMSSNLAEASDSGMGEYIKVGLKHGNSAVAEYTLQSEEGFLLGSASSADFQEGMPLPAYTTIHVTTEHGSILLKDEEGVLLSADLGSTGVVMPDNYLDEGILYLNNTPYRGGLMFLANSSGTINAINYISLEHYIYGVLNGELHHTNPKEALKAQAVAARSFACLKKDTHSSNGFDVCTSTHCQVYKGYSEEFPAIIQATDETRGERLYYQGRPVTGFYFKNSGGQTQNVEDVWNSAQGYLIGVNDPYSPSYPWTATLSLNSLKQKLEAAGYNPGTILSVSIKATNTYQKVSNLEIQGSQATINLKKEQIRNVLGATLIKSNQFTLSGDQGKKEEVSQVKGYNGNDLLDISSEVYILGSNGKLLKKNLNDTYGMNTQKTVGLKTSTPSEAVIAGDQVIFKGYGYGHGVGMPQDSAIQMAKLGFAYDEILKQYYTDIEIQ